MRNILILLTGIAFASAAPLVEAATPKAAEDINSPVVSSEVPLPKVRKAMPAAAPAKHAKPARHAKTKKKKTRR